MPHLPNQAVSGHIGSPLPGGTKNGSLSHCRSPDGLSLLHQDVFCVQLSWAIP